MGLFLVFHGAGDRSMGHQIYSPLHGFCRLTCFLGIGVFGVEEREALGSEYSNG